MPLTIVRWKVLLFAPNLCAFSGVRISIWPKWCLLHFACLTIAERQTGQSNVCNILDAQHRKWPKSTRSMRIQSWSLPFIDTFLVTKWSNFLMWLSNSTFAILSTAATRNCVVASSGKERQWLRQELIPSLLSHYALTTVQRAKTWERLSRMDFCWVPWATTLGIAVHMEREFIAGKREKKFLFFFSSHVFLVFISPNAGICIG